MPIKKSIYLLIVFTILISPPLSSKTNKKLTIKGVKLYSEEEIYSQLQLKKFETGEKSLAEVISSIKSFYIKNNFPLVKVYSTVLKKNKEYVLFVDEGRLGKIVVHNLNNYYSLKFKQQIDFPERVYNTETLKKNLDNLKKSFPHSEIAAELKQPPDYESNILQLDREIEKLELEEMFDTDLFDRYVPLHELHFFVTDKKVAGTLKKTTDYLEYNIHYKFPSVLIPEISFYKENNFAAKDYLESDLSMGIDPGLKGLVSYPPSNTLLFPPKISFVELTGEYKISPLKNKSIGPLLRGLVYHSNSSRADLGITEYKYLNVKATLAPEITLLKNLNVYAGIGTDQTLVYDSKIDYEMENHLSGSNKTYHNTLAEVRLKFAPALIKVGNRIDKYVIITYTSYLAGKNANHLEILTAYDMEFDNLSILSFRSKIFMLYGESQFFQHENVHNSFFKGFPGDSYYSGKKTSASGEYRFSIYQDYIYTGAYIEAVAFEPEGYLLSGSKNGINIGPTGRLLLYDQFELTAYFGFHILLPDKKTGTNFQLHLKKKW